MSESQAAGSAFEPLIIDVIRGSGHLPINGLAFDSATETLYGVSVLAQELYSLTWQSAKVVVEAPFGQGDDLVLGPDGSLVWSAIFSGEVRQRDAAGNLSVLASGLPGVSALGFDPQGTLYAGTFMTGDDAIYKIEGGKAERIMDAPGIQSFTFSRKDGALYAPMFTTGTIDRIDLSKKERKSIAFGFVNPAAARFTSQGTLYVVDSYLGFLFEVDPNSGAKTRLVEVGASVDKLTFDGDDRPVVSNLARNSVIHYDPTQAQTVRILDGRLAAPGGLSLASPQSMELYLADGFSVRSIQTSSGAIADLSTVWIDSFQPAAFIDARGEWLALSGPISPLQIIDRASGVLLHKVDKKDLGFSQDVTVLDDGVVLVLDAGTGAANGRLLRVEPEKATVEVVVSDLAGPAGIDADGKTTAYITETIGRVTEVDLSTGKTTVLATGLKNPEGIVLDEARSQVLVANVGAQEIVSVDLKTKVIKTIATGLPIAARPAQGVPGIGIPTGVAVNVWGDLFFSTCNGGVARISVD